MCEQQRRPRHGHGHESTATRCIHARLSGCEQRIIWTWERNPVDDHEAARLPRYIYALPQRERAEQHARLVLGKAVHEIAHGHTATLHEQFDAEIHERGPQFLFGEIHGSPRREQCQRTATTCFDEPAQLGQLLWRRAIASRCREMAGDVEHALAGGIEWRPDVDRLPFQRHRRRGFLFLRIVVERIRIERARLRAQTERLRNRIEVTAERQGGGRENHRAFTEQ